MFPTPFFISYVSKQVRLLRVKWNTCVSFFDRDFSRSLFFAVSCCWDNQVLFLLTLSQLAGFLFMFSTKIAFRESFFLWLPTSCFCCCYLAHPATSQTHHKERASVKLHFSPVPGGELLLISCAVVYWRDLCTGHLVRGFSILQGCSWVRGNLASQVGPG